MALKVLSCSIFDFHTWEGLYTFEIAIEIHLTGINVLPR